MNIQSIRLNTFLLILLSIIAAWTTGCAPKAPTVEIKTPLEDPQTDTQLPQNKSYAKGYAEYLKGRVEPARKRFQNVLREMPGNYAAQLAVGYTYISEEKWDQAESSIRNALEIRPEYPQAHFALAHVLESKQQYEAALEEFNEVERLKPEYAGLTARKNILKLKVTESHINEGRRLAGTNPEEAIEHLKKAQDLAPEISQIPVEIAEIFLARGNCQEATKYLRVAKQQMPDQIEIKRKYADCMLQMGEYHQALAEYQEVAVLQPEDPLLKKRVEEVKKLIYLERLPAEYQLIPGAEQVTRGQFAAYLILNLDYLKKFSAQDSKIIVDSIRHWAQSFILKSVNLGILDLFPNRTFQPNQPVSRMELAKGVSRILELLESEGRSLPDSEVLIPDISVGNVFYKTVAKTLSAGVLSLDADGKFHPYRKVSGAELVSVVNRLKSLTE